MKKLEEYTPSELAILSTVVGVIIAAKLNVNGQNVVGNLLVGVGQIILIIAAQVQNIESQKECQCGDNGSSNSKGSNMDLQKQIDELKEYFKRFEENIDH